MDVSADETKGSVLFSNFDAGNTLDTYYDLLFLSMIDGSLIRQLQLSSIDFNPLRQEFLFFYNSKIYFFAFDEQYNRIGFAIFNEATIGTQVIGSSLTLGKIDATSNNWLYGFAKGSSAQNYIILSLFDSIGSNPNSDIIMIHPKPLSGFDSFN